MSLTLVQDYTQKVGKYGVWLASYRCDCGKVVEKRRGNVNNGTTTSCGCRRGRKAGYHGRFGSPTWRSWINMRSRCQQPSASSYHNYGAKGVTVDPRWDTFQNFMEDMGERPSLQHCIGRIDHSKGYGPGNCEWQTLGANSRETNARRWARI